MKKELSIQTWTVRSLMNNQAEIADTFRKLASYGYTGVQTAGAFNCTLEEYAAAAKAAGLKIVGTHIGFDVLENPEEAARVHGILGTTHAGIGGMSSLWAEGATLKTTYETVERINRAAEGLAKYGLKFTYHHHAQEFAKVGGEMIMDVLVRDLDPKNVSFVLDTCWLQQGGVNILEWLEKLAGRVDILHLKDRCITFGTGNGIYTELGNGTINFKDVIRVANDIGVQEFCYEQDGNFTVDPLESSKQSAQYFFSLLD